MGITNISWVRNADGSKGRTWPVVTGCTPVSEACDNCYAAELAGTMLKTHPRYKGLTTDHYNDSYRWTGEVRLNKDLLQAPLSWRKPQTVFVASMGDLFHPAVPEAYIHDIYDVMTATPQHTYIVLTKRPERIVPVLYGDSCYLGGGDYLPNVWHLTTVENQEWADIRIPHLLSLRAMAEGWPVLGISAEPLLDSIKLGVYLRAYTQKEVQTDPRYKFKLDWLLCAGESGPHARAMHPDWARSLRDQAAATGTLFFFKGWGGWAPAEGETPHVKFTDGTGMVWRGKKGSGRVLDGQEYLEMPQRKGGGAYIQDPII